MNTLPNDTSPPVSPHPCPASTGNTEFPHSGFGRETHTESRSRRRLIGSGLLAGGLTVALSTSGGATTPMQDPRLLPPKVEVFQVQPAAPGPRAFTGVVEARVQSDLGFRVGGKLVQRSINTGQRVRKGQVLMQLDPVDLELSSTAQQATVASIRARYVQAKAEVARYSALVTNGAVSRQEFDQAQAAFDGTKAQLEAAEAQAKVSGNHSDYSTLTADADGVIVRTLIEPGQVVSAGRTVIQLAHEGPREALIHLPEGVRPELGTTASVQLYGRDPWYPGRLRELSDAADPASRTFAARYVLEGEAAAAPLGSTITLTLIPKQDSAEHSVQVPSGALLDRGNGPGVWIVNDRSEVRFRPVKVAAVGQEHVVVSSGIRTGENVVALGAHLLHEGQIVQVPIGLKHGKEFHGSF